MAYPTNVETLPTNHSNGQPIDPAYDNNQARIVNVIQGQLFAGGTHNLADHVADGNPHAGYATDADLAAHEAAANPHAGYATDGDLTTHAAAADPHSVYQKESERDQVNGYAGLGSLQTVHPSFLGIGTRDGTKVLGDQGFWVTQTGGSGSSLYPLPGGITSTLAGIDQTAAPPVSLQTLINNASSGGTVTLGPYVYRGYAVINSKNLTINGTAGQTSVRGSEIWDEARWAVQGLQGRPEYWRSLTALPTFSSDADLALGAVGGTRALDQPDQVFLNHKPLRRCPRYELPKSGEYAVDESGHVILADDPTGTNLVEVTTLATILDITTSNVTLNNIDFRHAASGSVGQLAAVRVNGTTSNVITVASCKFMHTHGIGLGGDMAPGSSITLSEFAYNGAVGFSPNQTSFVTGMTTTKTQSVFSYSTVHHNGHKGYDFIWGAGGTKWAHCNNWWIHHNEFYSNGGVGLWVDIHNTEFLMEYNLIHHNTAMGFCFEISGGLTVENPPASGTYTVQFRGNPSQFRYNILWENCQGDQYTGHPEASGDVFISASENITIEENLIAWSYRPINVYWNYTRGVSQMPTGSTNTPDDIVVRKNFIIGDMNLPGVDGSYNKNPLLSFMETGGTALFGATDVGAYDNRYWTRIYGNANSIDNNAAVTDMWFYDATAYKVLATFNTTDGGEGPTGGSTSSTFISTTNTIPVPTAVSEVLLGTSALYSTLTGGLLQAFVAANPLPIAPEAGHGYKPSPGMYGAQPPILVPITTNTSLRDDDKYVLVSAAAGNVTVTLPAPYRHRVTDILFIKRTDNSGNTVTISAADLPGNDTRIDVDNDSITIAAKGGAGTTAGWCVLMNSGMHWFVMAKG